MLSKCANPECYQEFRYLHLGKIFCLAPTPEVQAASQRFPTPLYERFWLCDSCSRTMTVVWDGMHGKAIPLRRKVASIPSRKPPVIAQPKKRAALAASRGA